MARAAERGKIELAWANFYHVYRGMSETGGEEGELWVGTKRGIYVAVEAEE